MPKGLAEATSNEKPPFFFIGAEEWAQLGSYVRALGGKGRKTTSKSRSAATPGLDRIEGAWEIEEITLWPILGPVGPLWDKSR